MVVIINKLRKNPIPQKRIKELLEKLSLRYRVKKAELAVGFVGNRAMKSMNKKYSHKNKATDVLSFPIKEKAADGKYYLGDIIICLDVARRQARKHGHSLLKEVKILAVHGFLHLLGFEHFKGLEEEEARIRPFLLKNG